MARRVLLALAAASGAVLGAAAGPARADVVELRNGTTLEGEVVAETETSVTLRFTGGQVPDNTSMPISRIKLSAEFVLSGDVTNLYWYRPPFGEWDRTFDNTDKDDNVQPCVAFFGEAGGMNMHRAGNNLLFADGHVAPFRKYDPQAITYHPTERRNWDEVERN